MKKANKKPSKGEIKYLFIESIQHNLVDYYKREYEENKTWSIYRIAEGKEVFRVTFSWMNKKGCWENKEFDFYPITGKIIELVDYLNI